MTPSKSAMPRNTKLITVAEARKLLGISANKMSALISSGTLPYEQDPLDHRVKLLRRADVEGLMRNRSHAR